jgi:hypothetical protein
MRIFYICSYGGCGSKILYEYLQNFGKVEHIHSRNPPDKLEYLGGRGEIKVKKYGEWFSGKKIPEEELYKYTVIYIYRNPVKSIYSRFTIKNHLKHIQTNTNNTLDDVLKTKTDLFGISEFYNNYTCHNKNRNYKIYCIKYEDLFNNFKILNETLGLPDNQTLYISKKETQREYDTEQVKVLEEIYKDVIDDMNNNKFIEIV